jgi:hypothetical protein
LATADRETIILSAIREFIKELFQAKTGQNRPKLAKMAKTNSTASCLEKYFGHRELIKVIFWPATAEANAVYGIK